MSPNQSVISIVLAGNPNAGKTTIFNALTGSNHHVGNYPGVTVEKKDGSCCYEKQQIDVVDLPGTYSLTASSLDEKVARDYLINEAPDVVVQVVDASSLERNFYLTVQLLELGQNLVIALNMMDVSRKKGFAIDIPMLSRLLNVPIVETVGTSGTGLDDLLKQVVISAENPRSKKSGVKYGADLGRELTFIEASLSEIGDIEKDCEASKGPLFPSLPLKSWVAIKLLECDDIVTDEVRKLLKNSDKILDVVSKASERIEKLYGDPSEIVIADKRYGFISGACQEAVKLTVEARHRFSDRIDDILAHRILGLPIFFGVIYLIFWITFTLGEIPMELIENGVSSFGLWVAKFWPKDSPSLIRSLLVDGIIAGVGGVLVFLPNIVLLFMGIAFLEDTGYIARAAFLTDWMMHKIGLHGRSLIPLVIGFGCTVPAIMATRTLESRRDRLTTMLVLPLMSCSARFPIYTLIIPAFFAKKWQAPMLWMIYFIGVLLAVVIARLLRNTLLVGSATPFVMELPIYRLPTIRGIFFHMWQRAKGYLYKAGTVILAASVIMWLIQTYPGFPQAEVDKENELALARIEYVKSIGSFASKVDVSGNLQKFLIKELELSEKKQKFYESTDKYHTVSEKLKNLDKQYVVENEKSLVTHFVLLRKSLMDIDTKYKALEEEQLGSVVAVLKEAELDKLKKLNLILYPVVYSYLNELVPGYECKVSKIEQQCASQKLDHSIAGRIGSFLEPLLKPVGFDRRLATALIGAFAAKEMFVAQMGIIASVDTDADGVASLRVWLQDHYSPLVGLNLLLFSLIATPCMATVAVMRRESGSWKWAALQLGGLTALAYLICLVVYQTFSFAGFLV